MRTKQYRVELSEAERAELELAALARQCLGRRLPTLEVGRTRGHRVGDTPQPRGGWRDLALHHGRCSHQAGAPLPEDAMITMALH